MSRSAGGKGNSHSFTNAGLKSGRRTSLTYTLGYISRKEKLGAWIKSVYRLQLIDGTKTQVLKMTELEEAKREFELKRQVHFEFYFKPGSPHHAVVNSRISMEKARKRVEELEALDDIDRLLDMVWKSSRKPAAKAILRAIKEGKVHCVKWVGNDET